MKVFISWSGELSKKVATALKPWIKCVLQATDPFLSSEDIDKGSLWFTAISDQLADTAVGIICLTRENTSAPWVLFEAGSLAKGLSKSRVCTFLVNLSTSDLEPPLSQFNATSPNKEDMFKLVTTINDALDEKSRLTDEILRMTFDQFWENISEKLNSILKAHKPTKHARRSQEELVEEILEVCRSIQSRVQDQDYQLKRMWTRVTSKSPAMIQYLDALRQYEAPKKLSSEVFDAIAESLKTSQKERTIHGTDPPASDE
jgi:hypothetical protein